jgi:hypothetical protein
MSDKLIDAVKATFRASRERAARLEAEQTKAVQSFKAIAVDEELGVLTLIGSAAHIVDREDESVEKGALIRMAFDFCASKGRTFKANHAHEIDCDLVASWPGTPVLKSGVMVGPGDAIPADDPIVAINIEKGNETHWFVGVRPNDPEVLKAAKNGEILGASWGGHATKIDA